MRTRVNRGGYGFASAWLLALCAVFCFVAGPAFAADAEQNEFSGPQSLSVGKLMSAGETTGGEFAPAAVCPSTVLVGGGGTSGNGRAPISNFRGIKTAYLITAAELAANGLPSGAAPTGIGWHYSTAPGVVASGTLLVYLQNTADATYLKPTTSFAAAIAGMTLVHSAATTLPNSTTAFDIPFVGGSPFTYSGGGLYVAFEWRYPVGTVTTAGVISCNTTLSPGLATLQSTTTSPVPDSVMATSAFRPETRLTVTINNDVGVNYVISYGAIPKSMVGPQVVQAVVVNKGNASTNVPVTLNITGAEFFTNTQIVPTLAACGGSARVTFAPFTATTLGADTVTVSVPADDVASNNSKSKPLDVTATSYSYKHAGTTSVGGSGLTGATGAFVGKFTTTVASKVSQVTLEFFAASATTYRVVIYPDSGSGTPGLVPLYEDAVDRTVGAAGPVTITLPSPVSVPAGIFFAGAKQTNTTNASVAFDDENPIRAASFFFATPNPPAAWVDFSPNNSFKLNIGITLIQCTTAAECNDNNACTDDACTNALCTHVNNSATSCDGNSCSDPDQCLNGVCIPGPNPCNDSNACTIDLCAQGGGCTSLAVDCNDNNPCTDDFCIPATGCGHSNNTAACSDGNACTIGDTCSGGVCVPGVGALPAPIHLCSPAGGITIPDTPATGSPYPSTITVAGQPSVVCSVTVELNGITHTFPDDLDILLSHLAGPNAIVMSDVGGGADVIGLNMTLADAAATAIPDAGPLVAGSFKPTNVNPGTGTEVWPAPAPAPSGGSALSAFTGTNPNGAWNLWVVDDEAGDTGSLSGWCLNVVSACATNADCDDSNVCTGDTCTGGVCTHVNNNPCDDGNACTANSCNAQSGQCENPPIVCNDNNACTDDSCNPQTGCVYTANDNNACSDNNLCTTPDVCQGGVCVGQNPVVCPSDGNICTTEACVPATGQCQSTNNTNACDDGNPCTTGDACGPVLSENFDSVAAPNLPGAWSSANTGGSPWTTVSTSFDSAPNSAFGVDGSTTADEALISPPINVVTATAQLTFRTRWTFEGTGTNYDGGVLEIDIAGGGFQDIVTAGGSFVSGGYNGTIFTGDTNPLAGRAAWAGVSAGYPAYLTSVVNLPAAAAGQTITLQWRVGTDSLVGSVGQNVDSILILDGTNTCQPGTGTVNCDDQNPCTDDYCSPGVGCQHSNNIEPCNDGNACTILDTCSGGACTGTTIVCDDSNPCTTDSCNTGTGCVFAQNNNACDDGNACTAGDACANGACTGSPITAPPETQNLAAAADKSTYSWSSATFATRYDVVRGSTGAFPVGPGGADEVCFDNLAGTAVNDPATPAAGSGFSYLSRGENSCGNGIYGFQGVNGAPGAPRVSTTCP